MALKIHNFEFFGRHFALWPLTEETNYEGGEEDFMIMFEETEILSLSTIHIL